MILRFLATLLVLPHLLAQANEIRVTEVIDEDDQIRFTFASTGPAQGNYQPQYLKDLSSGLWLDIPDATISEIENSQGHFQVNAPKFGDNSGFYRVIETSFSESDPLQLTSETEEILLLWGNTSFNDSSVNGQLYYHAESPSGGPQENQLYPYPKTNPDDNFEGDSTPFTFEETLKTADHGSNDSLSIDLDGDGRPDPLHAWVERDSNDLQLVLTEISSEDFSWSKSHHFTVPGGPVRNDITPRPIIRLIEAQLDSDPLPEVIIAFTGEDNFIHIQVADFGTNLSSVEFGASTSDIELPFNSSDSDLLNRSSYFDIAAADFDSDGLDEIAVLATEPITISGGRQNWQLYATFYDYDPSLSFESRFLPDTIDRSSAVLFTQDNRDTLWLERIAAVAADFSGDGTPELAVNYNIDTNSSTRYWYLQLMKPSPDFSTLDLDLTKRNRHQNNSGSGGYPISILPFQLDDDPAFEILTYDRNIGIFDISPDLSTTKIGNGYGPPTQSIERSRRSITLTQLDTSDPNFGHLPEVVVTYLNGASPKFYEVATYKFTGDGSPGSSLNLERDAEFDIPSTNSNTFITLATGDFGGNGVTIGAPRRYSRTIVEDPIVILNAPPIHFDLLNGQEFDVNRMFPLECNREPATQLLLCPFHSRYTRTGTETSTITTSYTSSWSVGATAEGGFTIPIIDVGVKASLSTKYSDSLNEFENSTTTVVVDVQATANSDDRIYATTVDYDIWEYPLLVDGVIVSHALFVKPTVRANTWIGSKSSVADGYRPRHEPGNLLSYRQNARAGANLIRNISGDRFGIDSSSAFLWSLTKTTNDTTSSTDTIQFEIGGSASFDIPVPFIPNFSANGDYSTEDVTTRSTSVTDSQGLRVALAETDSSIPGTDYFVTPYMYWNRAGSLVLDYAVELPAGTNSIPTFWGQRYGQKPDPAFILPKRLDPEKGFPVIVEKARTQCRHIAIDELEPRRGQTVNIKAQINNFSLLNLGSSFRIRFYQGNPSQEGSTLIGEKIHGTGIPSRDFVIVSQSWTIPNNLAENFVEIYVVIDPENQIDEIHEDNNLGWISISLRNGP